MSKVRKVYLDYEYGEGFYTSKKDYKNDLEQEKWCSISEFVEKHHADQLADAVKIALEQYTPGMTKTILSEALKNYRGEGE